MNRTILRAGIAGAAIAATLATGAAAAPVVATLRVEGAERTLIPTRVQPTDTTRVADRTGPIQTVPGPTALNQLARATVALGIPTRHSFTAQFGPLASVTERIGPDDQGTAFDGPGFWLFKVNHRSAPVAANRQRLRRGDEVLWYFTADFSAAELDVLVPRGPRRVGRPFTVTVRAFDGDGRATRAAGARVRYAGTTRVTDAKGRARFGARLGRRPVSAVRGTDIRSPRELVCGYRRIATCRTS